MVAIDSLFAALVFINGLRLVLSLGFFCLCPFNCSLGFGFIVSRGYGGEAKTWPQQVRADSDYVAVGDEAVMIAARTECPMAVGPERSRVIQSLLDHHDIDVILSDDGLQHYAMQRDIEIAVVTGTKNCC